MAANSQRTRPTTERDFVSISDFEAEIRDLTGAAEFFNGLFYGDSGCGKTVLAGSCPNSLFLACEPGYISAANTVMPHPVGKRKVRGVWNTALALAACDYLEAGGYREYDWIIVDGATTLETKIRLNYAAEAFDANPAKRAHRNLPDKPDYFNTQNFLRGWFARLIDLPCNLLVTAHAMRMDNDEGDRLVMPSFQQREGALSNYVSGLMHVVGFMRPRMVDKGTSAQHKVRRVIFDQMVDPKTDTVYFAKDQYNRLPRYMDDTNMGDIMAYVNGNKKRRVAKKAVKRAAR